MMIVAQSHGLVMVLKTAPIKHMAVTLPVMIMMVVTVVAEIIMELLERMCKIW